MRTAFGSGSGNCWRRTTPGGGDGGDWRTALGSGGLRLTAIDSAPCLHRDANVSFRTPPLRNFRLRNFPHPGHPRPSAPLFPRRHHYDVISLLSCNVTPSPSDVTSCDVIHFPPLPVTSLPRLVTLSPAPRCLSVDPS